MMISDYQNVILIALSIRGTIKRELLAVIVEGEVGCLGERFCETMFDIACENLTSQNLINSEKCPMLLDEEKFSKLEVPL